MVSHRNSGATERMSLILHKLSSAQGTIYTLESTCMLMHAHVGMQVMCTCTHTDTHTQLPINIYTCTQSYILSRLCCRHFLMHLLLSASICWRHKVYHHLSQNWHGILTGVREGSVDECRVWMSFVVHATHLSRYVWAGRSEGSSVIFIRQCLLISEIHTESLWRQVALITDKDFRMQAV